MLAKELALKKNPSGNKSGHKLLFAELNACSPTTFRSAMQIYMKDLTWRERKTELFDFFRIDEDAVPSKRLEELIQQLYEP